MHVKLSKSKFIAGAQSLKRLHSSGRVANPKESTRVDFAALIAKSP